MNSAHLISIRCVQIVDEASRDVSGREAQESSNSGLG